MEDHGPLDPIVNLLSTQFFNRDDEFQLTSNEESEDSEQHHQLEYQEENVDDGFFCKETKEGDKKYAPAITQTPNTKSGIFRKLDPPGRDVPKVRYITILIMYQS